MDGIDQISLLKSDISMLKEQIADNNSDISKLEEIKAKIMTSQEELGKRRTLTTQPNISPETWEGNYADAFLKIRNSIEQEFKSILDLQIEVLIDNISIKTSQLEELNETYEDKIHEKELEINFYQNL